MMDVFHNYIRNQDAKTTMASERRPLNEIQPLELDGLLSRFFMESVKKTGDPYEPDCLSTIHRGLKRYLEGIN